MNTDCDLVRDLLPLYVEDVASKSSKRLVRDHLCACATCEKMYKEMKKQLYLPPDTDVQPLLNLSRNTRRKAMMTVITFLFLAAVILHGLYICYNVPIWFTAEEAIEKVEMTEAGELYLYTSQYTCGNYGIKNGYYSQGLRLLTPTRQKRLEVMNSPLQANLRQDDTSFLYVGDMSGGESTLLWGSETDAPPMMDPASVDHTMEYLFWGTLLGGIALLSLSFCAGKYGVWLRLSSALLLSVSFSCWFVMGGRFLCRSDDITTLAYYLTHILMLAAFLFGFVLSVRYLAVLHTRGRKTVDT